MAIDPDKHVTDPKTGFAVEKDTGNIVGLIPTDPAQPSIQTEWPKWVVPHDSQIVRKAVDGAPEHVSTPGFAECHVNRVNGEVTVLVHNEDEEAKATSDASAPAVESEPEVETVASEEVVV